VLAWELDGTPIFVGLELAKSSEPLLLPLASRTGKRTGFGLRDWLAHKSLCRNIICHLTKVELDGVKRLVTNAGLYAGSFPFPCCFSFSIGRGYGFAPMRGILLPTVADGCRNPDFRSGLGCVDLVGEPGPCSSGMVSGSLASITGRTEKLRSFVDFEGLEISESDADLEKGLAKKGALLGEMGSSDPLRSLSDPDIPEATARSTASDVSDRTGLRVRSACVWRVKTGRPNMPLD
jgi:hypothetical protein